MNSYENGDRVRVFGTFTDTTGSGANIDPTAVRFKYQPPGSTTVTRTYGASTHIVKSTTGAYYVDLVPTVRGIWRTRWDSSGVGTAASESQFTVKPGLV